MTARPARSLAICLPLAFLATACATHDEEHGHAHAPVPMPFEASLVTPGEGRDLAFPSRQTTMLYHGKAPSGGVSVLEVAVAPKSLGAPPHTHSGEDEYFYVLEGEVSFLVGDGERKGPKGSFGAMPRGLRHAFWNATDQPARLLVTIVPGAFAGFFEEVSAEIGAKGLTDREVIGRLLAEHAAKYGCTVHGEEIAPLVEKHGLR